MTVPALQPMGSGIKTIATTGVAVPFSSSSIPAKRIDIQAYRTNANNVVIGASNIGTTGKTAGGIELVPGQVYDVELTADLIYFYVNGTSGDGVSFNWYIGDRV